MIDTDKFKQWVVLVTVISAAGGIITSLMPKSKLKSVYAVFSGFVLLYTVFSPLTNKSRLDFDFGKLFSENSAVEESLQSEYGESVLGAYESGIEKALTDKANGLGVGPIKAKVQCEASGEEVSVKSVKLFGSFGQSEKAALAEIVSALIGKDTKIIFAQGEENEKD